MMLLSAAPAQAHWVSANPCACYTPIARPCYRTVPVTEYRQIRQIIHKPVYETKYVDQKVTAYRPVTERRTASVPTVNYQNVTEHRTVYRNCGYWRTRYECRHLPSPCEYDPRPHIFGWLNRTAYSIRATFTPRVVVRREFVPRVVAETIPTTRTVAHHGVRQVTYKVTRMVPYTTTRRVAVNTVRYVAQQVVRQQPVTVWRRIPIGTTIAYSVSPTFSSRTALQPTPDPVSRKRTADSADSKYDNATRGAGDRKFQRDSSRRDSGKLNGLGTRRSSRRTLDANSPKLAGYVEAPPRRPLPSIVRTSRWVARRRRLQSAEPDGPSLGGDVSVVRQ
ncbi:MAG: hypothetical protein ACE5KM_00065 [Planctomycetaceae bacterium]